MRALARSTRAARSTLPLVTIQAISPSLLKPSGAPPGSSRATSPTRASKLSSLGTSTRLVLEGARAGAGRGGSSGSSSPSSISRAFATPTGTAPSRLAPAVPVELAEHLVERDAQLGQQAGSGRRRLFEQADQQVLG